MVLGFTLTFESTERAESPFKSGVIGCEFARRCDGKLASCVQEEPQLCNNSYNEHLTVFYNLALEASRGVAQVFCYIHGYPSRCRV